LSVPVHLATLLADGHNKPRENGKSQAEKAMHVKNSTPGAFQIG
jgi:hypothetical protein